MDRGLVCRFILLWVGSKRGEALFLLFCICYLSSPRIPTYIHTYALLLPSMNGWMDGVKMDYIAKGLWRCQGARPSAHCVSLQTQLYIYYHQASLHKDLYVPSPIVLTYLPSYLHTRLPD